MTGMLSADVRVALGAFELDAALTADPGEIVAVLGPNGAGKSTLLAAVAGHRGVAGTVRIGDRVLDGPGHHVAPADRRVGLLGQRALLFPHLTALENVAFGPRSQGRHRSAARDTARAWLERVGLGDLAGRRPAALSGGQQQRVAIARAFAAAPDALLLDEPFAALDVQTGAQVRRIVAGVAKDAGIPILLVTHDPQDARELADRTVVLQSGRVVDEGPTHDVLRRRSTEFVAALHAPGAWTATVTDIERDGDTARLRTMEHPDAPLVVPADVADGLVAGVRLRLTVTVEEHAP
ncbi:sulfate/molybdate ABC transporter ATP-binding protein [Microbacterium mangrovi]|uniref:sulfate/molybdate ABC transporter ATP-binding protein n=1 Tax=Microbacterium mangrovi TaxID=1348253 RepID=UPI00068A70DA|nr:ATP-binding cassette domain-containing protein [Microbacterium mangrovi]